jgi:hypothetical protein
MKVNVLSGTKEIQSDFISILKKELAATRVVFGMLKQWMESLKQRAILTHSASGI